MPPFNPARERSMYNMIAALTLLSASFSPQINGGIEQMKPMIAVRPALSLGGLSTAALAMNPAAAWADEPTVKLADSTFKLAFAGDDEEDSIKILILIGIVIIFVRRCLKNTNPSWIWRGRCLSCAHLHLTSIHFDAATEPDLWYQGGAGPDFKDEPRRGRDRSLRQGSKK